MKAFGMKLHFCKVFGLGFAFELSHVMSDDLDWVRREFNWRIYLGLMHVSGSWPVTKWKEFKWTR